MTQAETVEEEFLQIYGREAWTDWQRLLVHFDLGEGFAFLVLLLPGAIGAKICQRHLSEHLASKGKRLAEVACEWRDDARRLPERLFNFEVTGDLGGVWTGSVVPDSDPEIDEWRKAWRWGLASLNERRNPLQRHFSCPLVLVGDPWLQALLREAAPDLWSIRTAVVSVIPSLGPAESSEGSNVQIEPGRFLKGEAASDPDYTLEQAGRLRGRPGMESTLARLLLRSGNGFYEHARYEAAEECFREAAETLAQLAPSSAEPRGDWAASLNNLAVMLSKLGRREEALAKAQEAVRIYEQAAQARPEAFLPDFARSCGVLGSILGSQGRYAEAAAVFARGIRALSPLLRKLPKVFSDLAANLCQSYTEAVREAGMEPDRVLLGQVERVLEELRRAKPSK